MALPRTTPEVFANLAERAGLKLSPGQLKELHATYHRIEAMAERVRGGGERPVAAEPALVFRPGGKPR
jgi:hypothetical protein